MPITKRERLLLFIERLESTAPAGNLEEAKAMLEHTLIAVEDEFSGIPYRAEWPATSGRMYPPKEDSRVKSATNTFVRYRNRGHYTEIGANGAIRIRSLGGVVLIDKPGKDGKRVEE